MKFILLSLLTLMLAGNTFSQRSKIEENRFLEVRSGKYGLADSLGKPVVPFIYESIEYKNSRLIVRKNGLQGLITTNSEVIIPVKYQFVLPRNNNRFILWTTDSRFGLCDNDGSVILPVRYKGLSSTGNDEFYIARNDRNLYGVYNSNGDNVLPEMFNFFTVDDYKVFAMKDDQPMIIDLQSPKTPLILDTSIAFVNTVRHHSMGEQLFQIVKKSNKFGVINSGNDVVIPIIYDEVSSSQDWRHYIIKVKGKLGIIRVDGIIVKEPVYDAIELRKEYVLLKRDNKKDEIYSYR